MCLIKEYNDRGEFVTNNPDGTSRQQFDSNQAKLNARRNRRSRRLQKKNSLDVQFRRRFSMLRDVNAASNNIYNASISNGFNGFNDLDASNLMGIASALGRDSRASSMMPGQGPRASMGNMSSKLLNKNFNKILINMQQQQQQPQSSQNQFPTSSHHRDGSVEQMGQAERWSELPTKHKKNRKRKAPIAVSEQNI